ncbi:MAG: hypothetical protein AAFQ94_00275 [Bacteroidota bacterium]
MISKFLRYEKLTIESHTDIFRRDIIVAQNSFTAMFNPESYSQSYNNVYDLKQGINTIGQSLRYGKTLPETLDIKLLLDGNGITTDGIITPSIIPAANRFLNSSNVYNKVQHFLRITNHMDGDIHEPRYLVLKWGDLRFDCRLDSVNVSYTQFDESGSPLRAELDCKFLGDIEVKEKLKKSRKSSPDMTHYRVVSSHDQLPLMCEKIYGNPSLYVMVAMANGLNSFREILPGQSLYFPPLPA